MKVRRIIASVLTFMMLFMNVPTNVFAESPINVGKLTFNCYEDFCDTIKKSDYAQIVEQNDSKKTVKIKMTKDIIAWLYFNMNDGSHIILDANDHTISGGGTSYGLNEVICVQYDKNATLELIGNGTYKQGQYYGVLGGKRVILRSGYIEGFSSVYADLEEGYDYYTIYHSNASSYNGKEFTSRKEMSLDSRNQSLKITPHKKVRMNYSANGGSGTMDDALVSENKNFTFPECKFTAPDGQHFKGWQVEDESTTIYKAGDKKQFQLSDSGKTIKAIWENHTYDQKDTSSNHLASSASCTSNAFYYISCTCGKNGTETFEKEDTKDNHLYIKAKEEKYLRSKATNCQEHDTYWYTCYYCDLSAKDDSNAQNMYYSDTQVGEHQYSDKLSSNDTEHYYECIVKWCTNKKDVQKHTASDWIIDEEATSEKEGTKHKECTVCGRILETEKISKKESGTVEKKNDENITINNDVDHLSKNILTEQEVEKVKQGENAQIYIDVKDEVNKTDLEKVNALLDTYKLGKVYDISLWLKLGENTRQVTTTKEKLGMSLKVPEELINKDSKVKRTYKIMRVHEGKATLLDGTYDEKTQIITFETDQFSTYALVYSDTKVETPSTKEDNSDKKNDEVVDKDDKKKDEIVGKDNSTSNNQETVKPTVKEETVTPTVKKETKTTVKAVNKTETKKVKTGDDLFVGGFAFFLVVSLIGMIYLRKKVSK